MVYSQDQMTHDVYEGYGAKEVIINELFNSDLLDKLGPITKGATLGTLIAKSLLKDSSVLQVSHLINKKALDKDEYQRLSYKMQEISNELIEGMSHFDENLKLKL
jgi:hypothetical protein